MTDTNPEEVDTTVTTEGLLKLFKARADRGLDPDSDMEEKEALSDIRDSCHNILTGSEE